MRPFLACSFAALAALAACGDNLHIAEDAQPDAGPATLVSIAVTPPAPLIADGTSVQLTATATYSDSSNADVTAQAMWSSGDDTIATVVGGLVAGIDPGGVTITATIGSVSGMTTVTVSDATLTSIAVTPVNPSVPLGIDQQFTATGTFTDTTTQDLTTQAAWSSTDTAVATIASDGLATTLATGSTTITATMGSITGSSDLDVTAATLMSIQVTPVDPSVALGVDPQFTATGTFSDTSTQDLTAQVMWTSSDTAVATIDAAGLATTLTTGTTTITAAMGAIMGTSELTVTGATLISIQVTPVNPSVALGVDPQFTATGTYTDATTGDITNQVNWTSSDINVAQISNAAGSEGLATTLTTGTTTITATQGSIFGTSDLTVTAATLVSIAVTPATAGIFVSGTQPYTATGTYSDATSVDITTQVTWASTDTGVAQISNAAGSEGLATGVGPGMTSITATQGSIVSPTATLTVTARPTVVATVPTDGAVGVPNTTTIAVTFSQAMNPATLTGQITLGACTGTIQVSSNSFTSCIPFTTAAPAMSAGDTVATLTPVALGTGVTYKSRVLAAVQSAAGATMAADFVQPNGFTTATGLCGTTLMISQVYGGGGNAGAQFNADFVELHNPGPTTVSLTGMAIQYASAAGTTWQVSPMPAAGSVPAGGYFLVQISAAGATGAPLTADHVGLPTIAMSATAGKVALTSSAIALTGACPAAATIVDLVGYGAASCSEVFPVLALSNTTAAIRNAGGCPDGNNLVNFSVLAPAPRNSATAAFVCECTANETDGAAELDYCNLQFPPTINTTVGGAATDVYGRVFELGLTEAPGPNAAITAQVGVGPSGVNPATSPGWGWAAASYNIQVGNDDEYVRSLSPPASPGTYSYTSRFTRDGVNWTYCDLDGAGSNAGLTFDPGNLGALTVTP